MSIDRDGVYLHPEPRLLRAFPFLGASIIEQIPTDSKYEVARFIKKDALGGIYGAVHVGENNALRMMVYSGFEKQQDNLYPIMDVIFYANNIRQGIITLRNSAYDPGVEVYDKADYRSLLFQDVFSMPAAVNTTQQRLTGSGAAEKIEIYGVNSEAYGGWSAVVSVTLPGLVIRAPFLQQVRTDQWEEYLEAKKKFRRLLLEKSDNFGQELQELQALLGIGNVTVTAHS